MLREVYFVVIHMKRNDYYFIIISQLNKSCKECIYKKCILDYFFSFKIAPPHKLLKPRWLYDISIFCASSVNLEFLLSLNDWHKLYNNLKSKNEFITFVVASGINMKTIT